MSQTWRQRQLSVNAATLLSRDRWVGSIETGKLAALIVIDGNPLGDIETLQRQVCFVMKWGRVYRETLNLLR